MEGIKYIPKSQLFDCSVELSSSRKFFVWDGVPEHPLLSEETGVLDVAASFDVSSRMERLSYSPSLENIPPKAVVIRPEEKELTQVIFVRSTSAPLKSRVRIECSKAGNYEVLLCSHTAGGDRFYTEEVVEVNLCKGARLDLVIMQNENSLSRHSSDFRLKIEEGALLKMNTITLHAGNISNNLHALLCGKKSECRLNGLYLADGEQVIDTDVTLVHQAEECVSRQLFKGILSGNSRSRFTGEVVVCPSAQNTEAYQANNNLLTSESARASSDPHLVIYADDVKCSHGSTAGTIGDEELFYMRSRGISESEARILQQQAFAGAVLETISRTELRDRLSRLVERRLRGEDTVCAGCDKRCC